MGIRKIHLMLAGIALLMAATCLRAQDYVRQSGPQLFSYDELVQLSSDQEMNPQLAEKLRLITTTGPILFALLGFRYDIMLHFPSSV